MALDVDLSYVRPLDGGISMHFESTYCPVFPAADLQHSCALRHSGGADHWSGNIAGPASDVREK